MFTTTTTPKCTGSIPSPCATGTSSGTTTSRIVTSSITTASTSISTLTHSRNPVGDRCSDSSAACSALGTPSLATA